VRKLFASLCATLVLAGGVASTAGAQQKADGLVVVQIGDITVQDVNVAVAAQSTGAGTGSHGNDHERHHRRARSSGVTSRGGGYWPE
jgi:hypothetical protein